jgi:hypothetical protein
MSDREKVAKALFDHERKVHPEWVPWEKQASWNRDVYFDRADVALGVLRA